MQRELRLVKKKDFNSVYRFGKSAANQHFVLYYMPQKQIERFRLGVSVSKKIGNAVVRNRMRRLIKEIVRLNGDGIKPQTDLILIARKPAVGLTYAELEQSILHVMRKAGIYSSKKVSMKSASE